MRENFRWFLISILLAVGQVIAPAQTTPPVEPDLSAAPQERTAPPVTRSEPVQTRTDPSAKSIVKIFSTVRYPDPYKPWGKQAPMELSGSGVVIEGNRILTCAHAVLYSVEVQVQANESAGRWPASIVAIAPGIDLAVLKLDDDSFFASHPPLPRAKTLPEVRDAVMAYGYPLGGSGLSITRGIISRVEFALYNTPVAGLRIQVDAAINPGNSGGPAIVNDRMIGLAFSALSYSQNISYVIPCEEIDLFLKDIEDGHYDGKPMLLDDFQGLGNPSLRSFLKLDRTVAGVVVHHPESAAPDYPLKEWDVITRIGDLPIDDSGGIKANDSLRVFFKYEVQKLAKGGKVPLTVLRNGKEFNVSVPAPTSRPLALPSLAGGYPSYFVYGPIVFSSASVEFISGFMRGTYGGSMMGVLSAVGSPLITRMNDRAGFEGEQLVVVSAPFFPHRLARGYTNPAFQVVKSVNGTPIRNLGHLVEVLRDLKDEFVRIDFENRSGETQVFRRAEMVAATDSILIDNDVRSQASADMMAIWNAKAGK